ncbi:MAG: CRISPR-associated exonuclease Cas4 [Desulfonauticus sp.]|nr:CRISPR-associated exonuclease Cas4 [Desulfonauticus sp.]
MKNELQITSSIIEAYIFCKKQAWLMSRQISGDQYNDFLAIGRLISEESFKRDKKEILIDGGKIDFVRNDDGVLTLVEVKKSEKFLEAAKIQLLYYLFRLKNKGYIVKGEIHIPKSKKVFPVEINEENEFNLKRILKEINELLNREKLPAIKFSSKCRNCSYFEFCWS